MEKRTALYDIHVKYGGRLVEYAGYLLPVQYSGIAAEHRAVRTAAGIFDVSHMGEFVLEGPDALANLQNLLTNDFSAMRAGQVKYSPMCNENGGIIDDLLVYCKGGDSYMIVVNAANRAKDFDWMSPRVFGNARLSDISDDVSQIALQGPVARDIVSRLCAEEYIPVKNYNFSEAEVAGIKCALSTTGYTGEKGFELYCGNDDAPALWEALMEAGREYGLIPCGLGARDTLRLEAGMPLYGHEMTEVITPLETGLGFFVKSEKENFIGKSALEARSEPAVRRVGLVINGRGVARGGERIFCNGTDIGFVTSGTVSPVTKQSVAMAIISKSAGDIDTALEVEIRAKLFGAQVVKLPFNKN